MCPAPPLRAELQRPEALAVCPAGDFDGAVVVDLFRATSTLQVLVESGHEVEVVASPEAAYRLREQGRDCVGEWHGDVPDGFVGGNSPLELSGLRPGPQPVVFLSSNGAGALTTAALHARTVLAGCRFNLGAVARTISHHGGRWVFVPAGCRGEPRLEDDWVCARLADQLAPPGQLAPSLSRLRDRLRTVGADALRAGPSAQWLTRERSGAADLELILTSPFRSELLPVFDGRILRGVRAADGFPTTEEAS